MILALSRFRIQDGLEQEVSDAFVRRPWLVEAVAGFLGLEVFRDSTDPQAFVVLTRWADRAAFEGWHASPEHHASHALMLRGLKLDPAGTELIVTERIAGAGHVVGGDVALDEQQALIEQLQARNADLVLLTRENARLAAEAERAHRELRDAHWHIPKIADVLPMCLVCHRVQTSPDGWEHVAAYLKRHSDFLSHGYCASCAARLAEEAGEGEAP